MAGASSKRFQPRPWDTNRIVAGWILLLLWVNFDASSLQPDKLRVDCSSKHCHLSHRYIFPNVVSFDWFQACARVGDTSQATSWMAKWKSLGAGAKDYSNLSRSLEPSIDALIQESRVTAFKYKNSAFNLQLTLIDAMDGRSADHE